MDFHVTSVLTPVAGFRSFIDELQKLRKAYANLRPWLLRCVSADVIAWLDDLDRIVGVLLELFQQGVAANQVTP